MKLKFRSNLPLRVVQVEAQMEELLSREAREMEVCKRELMAWFKEQKKEQEQSRMLEEHTAKEKFKVLGKMECRPRTPPVVK